MAFWLYQIVKRSHLESIYALFHFFAFLYLIGIIGRPFRPPPKSAGWPFAAWLLERAGWLFKRAGKVMALQARRKG